jgi:hypothetical protein
LSFGALARLPGVSSSGARGGGTLIEMGCDAVVSSCRKVNEMGVFGSTDEVWMVMFFGVDSVLVRGFKVKRGVVVSV